MTVICICLALENAFHLGPVVVTDQGDNLALDDTQSRDTVSDQEQKQTNTKSSEKNDKVSAYVSSEIYIVQKSI